jgi:glycosyltransferase involved in cell wall biosynthesis
MRIACLIEEGRPRTGPQSYRALLERALAPRHTLGFFAGPPTGEWDLVHILDIKRVPLALVRALSPPVVADLHDHYWVRFQAFPAPDLPLRRLLMPWRRRHHLAVLGRAKSVVVHSRAVAEALPFPNVHVVPIGIAPEDFASSPGPREPLLLLVGRDCFRKGLPVLLQALRRLRPGLPKLRLEVIGDEFPHARLAGKLLALGLPVSFVPGLDPDELRRRYAQASALVLPSYQEAFGLTLLEAFAAGLPVVASRVGGIPELVEDGVSGMLFRSGDAAELAEKLSQVLTQAKLRDRLVLGGRQRLPGRFDLPTMAAGLEQVYQRTLEP